MESFLGALKNLYAWSYKHPAVVFAVAVFAAVSYITPPYASPWPAGMALAAYLIAKYGRGLIK